MNWITLWKAVQTRGSVTHAYRKRIITLCAPGDNWGWPEAASRHRGLREAGGGRAFRRQTGRAVTLAAWRWLTGCCNFRLLFKDAE